MIWITKHMKKRIKGGNNMFISYNYFRQHNEGKKIKNHKEFYKKFSNEREFGGGYSNLDHLKANRFANTFGHMNNIILRAEPQSILDIGSGDGVNLPLSRLYPNIDYYAIDYAEKTVDVASRDFPNVKFSVGDAFHLPYENESFDMVILSSVLIIYRKEKDRVALLKEAHRVLKKNGILVINVWNETFIIRESIRLSRVLGKLKNYNLPQDFCAVHFSAKDVKRMVELSGFRCVERIKTGELHGLVQVVQYMNGRKYHRNFGKEQIAGKKLEQNIKKDIYKTCGDVKGIYWFVYKLFPKAFSWYNIYVLEK